MNLAGVRLLDRNPNIPTIRKAEMDKGSGRNIRWALLDIEPLTLLGVLVMPNTPPCYATSTNESIEKLVRCSRPPARMWSAAFNANAGTIQSGSYRGRRFLELKWLGSQTKKNIRHCWTCPSSFLCPWKAQTGKSKRWWRASIPRVRGFSNQELCRNRRGLPP